ncbi:cytochrome c oxidase subunit II [Geomicrobium sediminis]|uniref:Cytochrome c oxidase subunit 2 n=1 Tax=Geomicrobium sediminis TaxID=1347788 RepID=A0ABS2PI07_9BACL|nr:cytochrome c oxidase subunit II [Geomicrobium sediminis]MBM7635074.1 cytochrome c oxidase subunit 2 [Geomicrobium sediminis]
MNGLRRLFKFAPFMAVFLFLAGCGERRLTALDPMGPQSQWIYDNMILSLYVMAIVIIVVFVLFFIVVVRFRHKEGDNEYPEQVHGSTKLEVAWTVIPLFLLAILAVPTVTGQFYLSNTGLEAQEAENEEEVDEEELDAESAEELGDDVMKITATGHQFWWQFDYDFGDDSFTAGNEVYVPVDTKVAFVLEAEDVMHSFWVPALAGKVDNIPGIENYMWLEASEPGVYKGKCAELCGPSHALMDFRLIALEQDEFDEWATAMQEEEEAPTESLANEGREIFEEQSCLNCHAVDGDGGAMGPSLANFGDRETIANYLDVTDENLKAWIQDPQSLKQGNEMPAYPDLSDEELDALVAYLNQLEKLDPETKEGLERD